MTSVAYQRIAAHHEKHMYKRGRNYGDAPLYASKRWKDHLRVTCSGTTYFVHMHDTDILTVTPDTITIDCDGWAAHPTTVAAVNDALALLGLHAIRMFRRKTFNYSQPQLWVAPTGKRIKYYDGITLDSFGYITSPLRVFQTRKPDAERWAQVKSAISTSGFRDVFKVVHAGTDRWAPLLLRFPLDILLTSSDHADDWHNIISHYAYASAWGTVKMTPRQSWSRLMAAVKRQITVVQNTDVVSY